MINNVEYHKELPVYGDGVQIRDWLYAEDHCKSIDKICNAAGSEKYITSAATMYTEHLHCEAYHRADV